MNNFNVPMAFQWIKGENIGKFVRSTGKTLKDGLDEYIVFEDGTQCNSTLIGEWIIPMDVPSPSPQKPVVADSVQPTQPESVPQKSLSNPVHDLLQKSKKKPTKIRLEITIDMPSEDLIRIVSDSYDDGEAHIQNYLISTVDQTSVISQISGILGDRVNTIVNKKKTANYENTL